MKEIVVLFMILSFFSCNIKSNQKDEKAGRLKNNIETNRNPKMNNVEEIQNHFLDDLFFIIGYKNDDLLGTFDGKLIEKHDRMVTRTTFGESENKEPVFEVVLHSENHTTLREIKTAKTTDYHLFNFISSSNALILKYDSDNNFLPIVFDAENRAFEEADISDYSIAEFNKGEKIIIKNGYLIMGERVYRFNGRDFDKITLSEPVESFLKNAAKGMYPEASTRLLIKYELHEMSKQQLKIMRNEIFARYGFIFREGGEMSAYFNQQDWYSPQHQNVNQFLTDIEKANIKLIKQIEAE